MDLGRAEKEHTQETVAARYIQFIYIEVPGFDGLIATQLLEMARHRFC